MERKKITFDSFIRGAIGCVLVVGILMLVERLSGVLLPFFIAWLIAYMVYPLVKFFQYKLKLKSRIVSILCALFLITVVGVSLFYLLVPPMISEISRMNDLLVTYLTNGAGNNVPQNLSEFIFLQLSRIPCPGCGLCLQNLSIFYLAFLRPLLSYYMLFLYCWIMKQ